MLDLKNFGIGRESGSSSDALEPELLPFAMRCYFNLVDGDEKILDQDGIEVSDLAQARLQAMKAIEELLQEDDEFADDWHRWTLEVTSETGAVLFTITLGGTLH